MFWQGDTIISTDGEHFCLLTTPPHTDSRVVLPCRAQDLSKAHEMWSSVFPTKDLSTQRSLLPAPAAVLPPFTLTANGTGFGSRSINNHVITQDGGTGWSSQRPEDSRSSLSYTKRPISKTNKKQAHRTFSELLQGQPRASNFPVPKNSGFHLGEWVNLHKLQLGSVT